MTSGLPPGIGVRDSFPPALTVTRESPSQQKQKKSTLESDPNGTDQHEAGAKLDAGKIDASLLLMFGKALSAVAEVGTFGAEKYTRGGWQSVPNGIIRYTAAMLRHVLKEEYETLDSDSGLAHDAHAAWNALARLELRLREEENADQQPG